MNIRSILGRRFAGCNRLVHWLRPLHGVGRLGHVWLGWLLLHTSALCNKPASHSTPLKGLSTRGTALKGLTTSPRVVSPFRSVGRRSIFEGLY